MDVSCTGLRVTQVGLPPDAAVEVVAVDAVSGRALADLDVRSGPDGSLDVRLAADLTSVTRLAVEVEIDHQEYGEAGADLPQPCSAAPTVPAFAPPTRPPAPSTGPSAAPSASPVPDPVPPSRAAPSPAPLAAPTTQASVPSTAPTPPRSALGPSDVTSWPVALAAGAGAGGATTLLVIAGWVALARRDVL